MNTWTLEYTLDNPDLGIEITCKLETPNPKAVPAILEKFIEEGNLIEFRLTLNVIESDNTDDEDDCFDEDDDNYWEDEE